jgi:hypothetical protein
MCGITPYHPLYRRPLGHGSSDQTGALSQHVVNGDPFLHGGACNDTTASPPCRTAVPAPAAAASSRVQLHATSKQCWCWVWERRSVFCIAMYPCYGDFPLCLEWPTLSHNTFHWGGEIACVRVAKWERHTQRGMGVGSRKTHTDTKAGGQRSVVTCNCRTNSVLSHSLSWPLPDSQLWYRDSCRHCFCVHSSNSLSPVHDFLYSTVRQ